MKKHSLRSFCLFIILIFSPYFVHAASISSLTPEDDAINVSIQPLFYRIVFDNTINRGTGNITLYQASDDSVIETWDVADVEASFSPTQVAVFPTVGLEPNTEYYILIDASAIDGFVGIADETTWNFTTDAYDVPRGIDSLSPENDAINVTLLPEELSIYFDGLIYAGTGNITLYKASDDSAIETWDITDADNVSVESQGVSFYLSDSLEFETTYYFNIDPTVIVPFDGIVNKTTWNFTTVAPPAFDFERISVNSDEEEAADGYSDNPSISSSGHYVAFMSSATNLVVNDTNEEWDVFVRDRVLGITERVSLADGGLEVIGGSGTAGRDPEISGDGRYVTFSSSASNLVAGDTNNQTDIFVFDRGTDTVERVSVSSEGEEGDDTSGDPSLSTNGQYVVFCSRATNLVEGDTNDEPDVFIYDRDADTVERIDEPVYDAVYCDNTPPRISDDGRYVVYRGVVWNDFFFPLVRYDRITDTAERVDVSSEEEGGEYGVDSFDFSNDGRYAVFYTQSTNLTDDEVSGDGAVFIRDFVLGTTELLRDTAYSSGGPSISEDGRYVAYGAYDEAQENIYTYRYDRETNTELNLTEGTGIADSGANSYYPTISDDGAVVVFTSENTDLVEDDTNEVDDIFAVDIPADEDEEEPPAEEEEEEEDNGGGSSRRHILPTQPSAPANSDDAVKTILGQLILVLQQLIQELLAQQQN